MTFQWFNDKCWKFIYYSTYELEYQLKCVLARYYVGILAYSCESTSHNYYNNNLYYVWWSIVNDLQCRNDDRVQIKIDMFNEKRLDCNVFLNSHPLHWGDVNATIQTIYYNTIQYNTNQNVVHDC